MHAKNESLKLTLISLFLTLFFGYFWFLSQFSFFDTRMCPAVNRFSASGVYIAHAFFLFQTCSQAKRQIVCT